MNPFVGEIRLVGFNFAPLGWLDCDGRIVSIAEYETLFTLIGTTYGGDGQDTFALPDYRGRVPKGMSSLVFPGETAGQEDVTLAQPNLPSHTHVFAASSAGGNSTDPTTGTFAFVSNGTRRDFHYATSANGAANPNTLSSVGGGQPHNNMQPYLGLRYIIATEGVFPQRD